ncbi:MAG: BCCT family transporter [Verrucomicrobiales bacterium]
MAEFCKHQRDHESRLKKFWGFLIHPTVFFVSALLISVFVVLTVMHHDVAKDSFEAIQGYIAKNFGWFYILSVDLMLVLVGFLLLSRHGRIRLGGEEARPEFSVWSWFAMLFSAGMGIGLLFWSVAEPIYHFAQPPRSGVEPESLEAAKEAMLFTFYHWGLHAWAIYGIVGLALAFFCYNKGLPLTLRSIFQPLLGARIYRWPGDVIDILAVIATLFGVATSLGLGAGQVSAGLNYLFPNIPDNDSTKIFLIAGITVVATISVVLGLNHGIRRLSELNLGLGAILLALVFVLGPTLFLLNSFVQNTGNYLSNLIDLSFWTEAYSRTGWQESWTIFYWGWWISWSPFVGMFIARISKGRTIREFLLGVLLVPASLTFLWLTVFGGTAIHGEITTNSSLVEVVMNHLPVALFEMLSEFPFGAAISVLALFLVATFFVTSSDSGSLVIDTITAGGHPDPPKGQRVFWAGMEGVVAAVLLTGGGLQALQTASITTGLPFALVLLVGCYSLLKGLRSEH